MNKHYVYKGYRLQTSGASNGTWICFINENDPLLRCQKTEEKALAAAKRLVDKEINRVNREYNGR